MRTLSLLALVSAVALGPAPAAAQVSARIHIGGPTGGWIEVGTPPRVRVVYPPPTRRIHIRDHHRGPRGIVVHRGKHRHDRYCRHSGYDRLVVYYDRGHDRYYDRDDDRYRDRDPRRGRGWQRVEVYRHDGRYFRSR